jgi:DNA-binding transcriptional LysR family regulator
MKKVVGLGMGMSIVPDVAALADPSPDIVVRPLDPPAPSTLALVEHRCKPNEPALEIVRNALLDLRTAPDVDDVGCDGKQPTYWPRGEAGSWSHPRLMA